MIRKAILPIGFVAVALVTAALAMPNPPRWLAAVVPWRWGEGVDVQLHVPELYERSEHGLRVLHRSFDAPRNGRLALEFPDGDVTIRAGTANRVELELFFDIDDVEHARAIVDDLEFEAERSGNVIRVLGRDGFDVHDGHRHDNGDLTLFVTLPARFDATVSTNDGDITIDGVEGSIELRTSDGDIVIGTLRGPALSISTSDGDIVAQRLGGPNTTVRTSDGDINVRAVEGSVEAATSDGDILVFLDGNGDARLRTSDGDILVTAPTSMAATVRLRGEDINIARGFDIVGTVSRDEIRGEMNGGGRMLDISTQDGTVSLRPSGG